MMKVFINPGHALGGSPDPGCVNSAENHDARRARGAGLH